MEDNNLQSIDIISPITLLPDHPITCLSVSSLSLHHFRNYASARIELSAQPVVLTGRNGAGKTNILEAVSLLTPGRGLRRAKLGEMDAQFPLPLREGVGGGVVATDSDVRYVSPPPTLTLPLKGGGNMWAIFAALSGMQGDTRIGTGRDPEAAEAEKRIVRIDGKTIRSQLELARHMAVIWLTPQMEQLFQESASAGRKFLDRLVYSFDPEHASRVSEYEFAMRERNRLLAAGRADAAWLDALEATMAETAAAIAIARLSACEHINHAIHASPLSFPKAHIAIHGFAEDKLSAAPSPIGGGNVPSLEVENAVRDMLLRNRKQDSAAGRTLTGPHRSEMRVIHMEKQMLAELCSTGEQKALLLSIVLAQARAGAQWHGVVPVLLLDEVAAHLDAVRRLELFEEICQIGAQVWMTGTDAGLFEGIQGKAQFFRVDDGRVF